MGPWLPEGFDLFWFEVFACTVGSLEWLTVEHPVVCGVLMGISIWRVA